MLLKPLITNIIKIMESNMSTQALVKADDGAKQHDELIQLVSFILADEEYVVGQK